MGGLFIYTCCERKPSIKMAIFYLFQFLFVSLLGYSWSFLAGQNVLVSISNRTLVSIISPGVSSKIHTLCQGIGMEAERNGAAKKWGCLSLSPWIDPKGLHSRPAFSSNSAQLSLELRHTEVEEGGQRAATLLQLLCKIFPTYCHLSRLRVPWHSRQF